MTYLLTFSGYGTHLHGDARGSWKNGALHEPHAGYEQTMRSLMVQQPFMLGPDNRPLILNSLVAMTEKRGWELLASHVRTTHVHLVLVCDTPAERALVACKAAATEALNLADGSPARKRWSRGGSMRSLRSRSAVTAAIRYVVEGQADPMSVYPEPPAPRADRSHISSAASFPPSSRVSPAHEVSGSCTAANPDPSSRTKRAISAIIKAE